ncbi:MAG TPA: hypothetical protein VEF89_04935 [Solirubrobacteraceae bacterium]|nr:hypothetical protein [Solirubrobacteraceae bacterium]
MVALILVAGVIVVVPMLVLGVVFGLPLLVLRLVIRKVSDRSRAGAERSISTPAASITVSERPAYTPPATRSTAPVA